MLPEVLADRLLQGQKAIRHLELAGPPSRRVMFRNRSHNSRGGWERWGPGVVGAEGGGVDFHAMKIERGQRDTKRKHY